MSEHPWIEENVATFLAGGLSTEERERFTRHTEDCSTCAQSLDQARNLDQRIEALFTSARPAPGLEDRMIRSLRTVPARRPFRVPMFVKVMMGAAAVLFLGLVGAGVSYLDDHGLLPMPGSMPDFGHASAARIWREGDSRKDFVDLMTETEEAVKGGLQEERRLKETGKIGGKNYEEWSWDSASRRAVANDRTDPKDQGLKNADQLATEMRGKTLGNQAVDPELLASYYAGQLIYDIPDDGRGVYSAMRGHSLARNMYEGEAKKPALEGQYVAGPVGGGTEDGRVLIAKETYLQGEGSKGTGTFKHPNDPLIPLPPLTFNGSSTRFGITTAGSSVITGLSDTSGIFAGMTVSGTGVQAGTTVTSVGAGQVTLGANATPDGGKVVMSGKQIAVPDPANPKGLRGQGYFPLRGPGAPTIPAPVFLPPPPTTIPMIYDPTVAATSILPPKYTPPLLNNFSLLNIDNPVARPPADPQPAKPPSAVRVEPKPALPPEKTVAQADKEKPKALPGPAPAPADNPPAVAQRKIIRSGDIEFEIDGFDSALDRINKIAGEERGFVATVNSTKLPNGKVEGTIVVRVPPDRLDTLLLKLRGLGDLKSQQIGSQDVTKMYVDLESRLRADRTMEERLLQIIKTGKGEVKDLVQAEEKLGVVRTRIELIEGELRYYNNLVSLSTLTIKLIEKEIRAAYGLTETELTKIDLEVEDVEKAYKEALAAVTELKGRVVKADLKKQPGDRYSAEIECDVLPDSAGELRARLKTLGYVARLDVDRAQKTEGGSERPIDIKTRRTDARFVIKLYNLANVAPRESVTLVLACVDAEAAYKAVIDRVHKTSGRVLASNLIQQRNDQTEGVIRFEVKTADADLILLDLKAQGEQLAMQVSEHPDAHDPAKAHNVTSSKRGFNVLLRAMGLVKVRETQEIQLATRDVPAGYRALQSAVAKAKGLVINARLSEQDKQNIEGQLDFEVRREEEPAIAAALKAAGLVLTRNVVRSQETDNVIDSKVLLKVKVIAQGRIPPRETSILGILVADVDGAAVDFEKLVEQQQGQKIGSFLSREASGDKTAKLVFSVPHAAAANLVEKFKAAGKVRVQQTTRNQLVPESDLTLAVIDVTISEKVLLSSDEGIFAHVRKAFYWIAISLSWVIFGVLFLLPWAILGWVIWKIMARIFRQASPAPPGA